MRKINPQAIIAILMGLFLGGILFTFIFMLTDGERVFISIIVGLLPPVLLICLVGDFFAPGPPED